MANKNYIRKIISDYCVLDVETTGLSAYYDEIIEIGILKVRNDNIVEKYSQLIKPKYPIDSFITDLTGIRNDMLENMPSLISVKDDVLSFIGDDILIGHNTAFDIRFLNAGFSIELKNKYIDTMQFARKLFTSLKHHRLSDLSLFLNLSNNEHRSLSDCITTKELYDAIKFNMNDRSLCVQDLWFKERRKDIDIKSIHKTVFDINEDNFFFNRYVAFSGKLEKMTRKEAMQIIVNLGGILDRSVKSTTNYLILGDTDYNGILNGEKSTKHKKFEELKLKGQDIEIIDECTFYDLIAGDI